MNYASIEREYVLAGNKFLSVVLGRYFKLEIIMAMASFKQCPLLKQIE